MFSVTAFYWGNEENLRRYVDHAKQYTDDIVVGFINLFGSVPQIEGLNIVEFDHKYLLEYGHSELMNIVDSHCRYDWTFHLAVGKRISNFSPQMLYNVPDNIAGYGSTEFGNSIDSWSNFHNKKRSSWFKTVHEVILPKPGYLLDMTPIIEWARVVQEGGYSHENQYYWNNEEEKRVCGNYRQISRLKWVALENHDPHRLQEEAKKFLAENYWVYNLGREELYNYLSNQEINAGM